MKIKLSTIAIGVMVTVGLLPAGVGLYKAQERPVEEAMLSPTEEPPTSAATESELLEGIAPAMTVEAPVASAVEDYTAPIAAVVEEPDVLATIGGVNTLLAGWFAWFFRRREKIAENIKKLKMEVGDLAFMELPELLNLLWKSTHSLTALKRLLLRTNSQFSIYGFIHTAMVPKIAGRPVQHIDRVGKSVNWLLNDFEPDIISNDWFTKERSLTSLVRAWPNARAVAVGFMQDTENTVRVDYDKWLEEENWRTDGTHSQSPHAIVNELDADEVGIMIFLKRINGEDDVYTYLAKDTELPETLEQWEEFIMAFRKENSTLVKECLIASIIAIHKPVI